MKVGILGGSFDPIHNGHLHMAVCAHQAVPLDQVWLMPAGHSPNKDESRMTDSRHRLRMCELASEPYDWLSVSSLEIDALEKSYTYRTFEKLHEQYPQHQFFFIMGGDSFGYFDQWKHPEIIASYCTILVIPRDQFSVEFLTQKEIELKKLFPCRVSILSCERYPASSTQIRQQLHLGNVTEHIPAKVFAYIQQNHLY
jgi:nicotinate-nucleotide adenylyltransferase